MDSTIVCIYGTLTLNACIVYELYIFNVTYIFQPAAYSTTHISTQYLHNI